MWLPVSPRETANDMKAQSRFLLRPEPQFFAAATAQRRGGRSYIDTRSAAAAQRQLAALIPGSAGVIAQRQRFQGAFGTSVIQRMLSEEQQQAILGGQSAKLSNVTDLEPHTNTPTNMLVSELLEDVDVSDSPVSEHMNEKGRLVRSEAWGGKNVKRDDKVPFENFYSPNVWVMKNNFNNRALSTLNGSEVVNWQGLNIAEMPGGPDFVVRKNVVNKATGAVAKTIMEQHSAKVRIESEIFSTLINETDNGRHTARILQEHGLRPVSAEVFGAADDSTIVIKAEKGEWKLPERSQPVRSPDNAADTGTPTIPTGAHVPMAAAHVPHAHHGGISPARFFHWISRRIAAIGH